MGLVRRSTWQVWLLANRDPIQLFVVIHIFSKQMKKADPKTVLPSLNAKTSVASSELKRKKNLVDRREKARKNAFNAKVIEIKSTKTKIQPESK